MENFPILISLENLKTLLFEKGNLNRNINEITNSLWGFGGGFFFSILLLLVCVYL